jgi:hypothetical protein
MVCNRFRGLIPVTTTAGSRAGWVLLPPATNQDGVTVYQARWTSPVLTTLASGESATETASLKTTKVTWDTSSQFYGKNVELLGSATTCTITAT